jgi:hypothetical protein
MPKKEASFHVQMNPTSLPAYPTKVLLAWAEAMLGHEDLRDWLMGSDHPELGVFCHALHNEPTSRAWLRHHGHAHLMALLEGAEGQAKAVEWLRHTANDTLADMALAADNDEEALARLMKGDPDVKGIWAQIALRIRHVKNDIEAANNDVHRIDPN